VTILHNGSRDRIRFYGIDAPEFHQAFGRKAKQFVKDLVFLKTVDVDTITFDQYGRMDCIVRVAGKVVNEELIRAGFAWVYNYYCKKPLCLEWRRLEDEARASKRGLWSDPHPIPPWDWRREYDRGGPIR
jgi:endonuclease YncB( thermonuclease family)